MRMDASTVSSPALVWAEEIAARIRARYPEDIGNHFHVHAGDPYGWAANSAAQIMWEEGPYEWAIECSLYDSWADILGEGPEGVSAEPYNGWLLCFYEVG